jgi:hypothetical protein
MELVGALRREFNKTFVIVDPPEGVRMHNACAADGQGVLIERAQLSEAGWSTTLRGPPDESSAIKIRMPGALPGPVAEGLIKSALGRSC